MSLLRWYTALGIAGHAKMFNHLPDEVSGRWMGLSGSIWRGTEFEISWEATSGAWFPGFFETDAFEVGPCCSRGQGGMELKLGLRVKDGGGAARLFSFVLVRGLQEQRKPTTRSRCRIHKPEVYRISWPVVSR